MLRPRRLNYRNLPVVVFFILLIAIALVIVKDNKSQPNNSPVPSPSSTTLSVIELPVPLSNRSITNLYLAYNFFGPIKEIKRVPEGVQLLLDTSEETTPIFLITPKDTKIFNIKNSQPVPATIEDLKPGLQVSISTTYDLKDYTWVTRTIHIPLDAPTAN